MYESTHTEDCDRMPPSNWHQGGQWHNTFGVKEEPEEMVLPTPTGESVRSQDCCGISTFTLHFEGDMHNTFVVKEEELDDMSAAAATLEGVYHEDARCIASSRDHMVQDGTHSVVVKEDRAETDFGNEEESFDREEDRSSQNGGADGWKQTDQRQNKHRCRFCPYSNCRPANVANHERKHTGEKPFSCSVCHKAFSIKCHLLRHERIHAANTPFKCSTCGREFSQESYLNVHKRIHTEGKSFSCHICHRVFIQRRSLQMHERHHTGEKPFKCETCGKAFSHKSYLNKHLKRPHT